MAGLSKFRGVGIVSPSWRTDGKGRHVSEVTESPIVDFEAIASSRRPRVLHVVVGHGLRTYFLNAVRSVRWAAPDDEILVVDNASPDQRLREDLTTIALDDPKMRLLFRDSNSLVNRKVGGLYDAYRDAFEIAIREEFDYVHLIQGDLQVLWWDSDVMTRAKEIFASDPLCVNIFMCLLPADREFDGSLLESSVDQLPRIREYGLVDLGLYDLERWRDLGVSFDNDELEHGRRYLSLGYKVICHPWPTDAPIPWPAVVRNGVQQGREVTQVKPYLLKPMTASGIAQLKSRNWTWLEDVCIPWGWKCLTPMWTTHANPDYLAARRQEAKRRGLMKSVPRWERSGLDNDSFRSVWLSQYRPSLWKLFVIIPSQEIVSRLQRRFESRITFTPTKSRTHVTSGASKGPF